MAMCFGRLSGAGAWQAGRPVVRRPGGIDRGHVQLWPGTAGPSTVPESGHRRARALAATAASPASRAGQEWRRPPEATFWPAGDHHPGRSCRVAAPKALPLDLDWGADDGRRRSLLRG
jgi:hypothetical protein